MADIKEKMFYLGDARTTCTRGQQETFRLQKEAEKRVGEIAAEPVTNDKEEVPFPARLTGTAWAADKKLLRHGQTLQPLKTEATV